MARRWALTSVLLYSTIAILAIGALLVTSRADRVAVAATFERKDLLQERSPMRPYGSLSDTARSTPACTASQSCKDLTPDGAGSAR